MLIDLTESSFEEFLTLIFDHPTPFPARPSTAWYWTSDPEFRVAPDRQIAHLTQLAQQAHKLHPRFTPAQLDVGLWLLYQPELWEHFSVHVWNPGISWQAREACILAIPQFWPRLFEHVDVGTSSYMLWHLMTGVYRHSEPGVPLSAEQLRIRDVMLEALTEQLNSDQPETQYAALHGLGHLGHRRAPEVIAAFLDSGRWIEAEILAYAREAQTGDIL